MKIYRIPQEYRGNHWIRLWRRGSSSPPKTSMHNDSCIFIVDFFLNNIQSDLPLAEDDSFCFQNGFPCKWISTSSYIFTINNTWMEVYSEQRSLSDVVSSTLLFLPFEFSFFKLNCTLVNQYFPHKVCLLYFTSIKDEDNFIFTVNSLSWTIPALPSSCIMYFDN